MKIICVWNEKGGVGKSATAFFIASGLAEAGRDVLLLDADRQQSCVRHATNAKNSGISHPFRVVTPTDAPENPEILVVDVKGGDSTWLRRADVIIQPVDADRTSIAISEEFRGLLPASAKRIDVLLVDRSKPREREIESDVRGRFLVIGRRSIVPRLLAQGGSPFRHALQKSERHALTDARSDFIKLIKVVSK